MTLALNVAGVVTERIPLSDLAVATVNH
ncbi:protein of unknown function [Cupriavidus neocaledonicus]|uniref:Uncharacterized protein n=1 Tax=Cupriavidus neocaledonicus TaxID=1040979 RepID=A0A375HAM1_9BURK|nr:protein of unknown function [Cupriavidus neocaledonicus]